MKIVWKDIFKPRYAILVEIHSFPVLGELSGEKITRTLSPAVMRVPIKRPLNVPFNVFYNELSGSRVMTICGSKRTLRALYGIGSVSKGNFRSATTFQCDARHGTKRGL